MNWDAIGAIGEIIGALAVVVTLIYLAIQTRHNSKIDAFAIRQYHNRSSSNVAYKNGMLSEQSWRLLYLHEVPRIVRKYPGLIPRFEAILSTAVGELDEEAVYLQKCITGYKSERREDS